jgi:hypothetical protein
MSKRYDPTPRFNAAAVSTASILALIVAMAASVPVTAHAQYRYRCGSPSTPEDLRACDLVKHDRPDELRRFVQRTSSIYGLYFYDYVRPADFDRWEAARQEDRTTSVAAFVPTKRDSEQQRN